MKKVSLFFFFFILFSLFNSLSDKHSESNLSPFFCGQEEYERETSVRVRKLYLIRGPTCGLWGHFAGIGL
jgi:hypothetical protein